MFSDRYNKGEKKALIEIMWESRTKKKKEDKIEKSANSLETRRRGKKKEK